MRQKRGYKHQSFCSPHTASTRLINSICSQNSIDWGCRGFLYLRSDSLHCIGFQHSLSGAWRGCGESRVQCQTLSDARSLRMWSSLYKTHGRGTNSLSLGPVTCECALKHRNILCNENMDLSWGLSMSWHQRHYFNNPEKVYISNISSRRPRKQ